MTSDLADGVNNSQNTIAKQGEVRYSKIGYRCFRRTHKSTIVEEIFISKKTSEDHVAVYDTSNGKSKANWNKQKLIGLFRY